MSNDLFVKTADPFASIKGALQHSQHKMCAILDTENPDEYRFGAAQGSVQGTLLPLSSRKGGIQQSNNPFGQIVVGSEYVEVNGELVQKPFTPTWLAQMIPGGNKVEEVEQSMELVLDDDSYDPEAAMQANEALQEQGAQRTQEFQESITRQREAEEQLSEIMAQSENSGLAQPAQAPKENQLLQMMQVVAQQVMSQQAPAQGAPAAAAPPVEKLARVKMQGTFGKYRGKYKHCYAEPDLVVLIHDDDTDVFSPPISDDPIDLSCNGEAYRVYFAGIEFDLPFADCGVQIFIRCKE